MSLYKMFSFQSATESPNEHLPMVHEYKNTLIEIFIFWSKQEGCRGRNRQGRLRSGCYPRKSEEVPQRKRGLSLQRGYGSSWQMPQPHVFEHLVPLWGRCFGRLCCPWDVDLGHQRRFTGDGYLGVRVWTASGPTTCFVFSYHVRGNRVMFLTLWRQPSLLLCLPHRDITLETVSWSEPLLI